jgi:hypothetical protein
VAAPLLRCQIPLGEFEQAKAKSLELGRRAREAGALAALSGMLHVAADTAFRLGDWDTADAAALEAIQVAGEVGQPAVVGWVLTIRARILAAQGRPDEGRRGGAGGASDRRDRPDRRWLPVRVRRPGVPRARPGPDRSAISELESVERLVEGSRPGGSGDRPVGA